MYSVAVVIHQWHTSIWISPNPSLQTEIIIEDAVFSNELYVLNIYRCTFLKNEMLHKCSNDVSTSDVDSEKY